MKEPSVSLLGTGLTIALGGLALVFAVNEQEVKLWLSVLAMLGLFLMVASLRPTVAAFRPIRWATGRFSHRRRLEVAGQIGRFSSELDLLVEKADGRRGGEADRLLVSWKERVLEYLDANIGADAATAFHGLATRLEQGQPRSHLTSSYEEHTSFLAKLQDQLSRGIVDVPGAPTPSGRVLPLVKSFLYRER